MACSESGAEVANRPSADPSSPPLFFRDASIDGRCTRLLSGRSRLESWASHHVLAAQPRRPFQSRRSTRPIRSARRTDSADLSEAFFYTDGPVAGPWFPKPETRVRFLVGVPSLCRSTIFISVDVAQRQSASLPTRRFRGFDPLHPLHLSALVV